MDPIGREAELALVTERLRDRRLVTLVGPGGIGKTTLARAAAALVAPEYGEGSQLIDLTRVDGTEGVRESIATQLGYPSFPALLDAPGDRSILVVVDNCEHVLDAAADAIEHLLGACQMPTVLATSRSALELPGEVVVPLGPLSLPPTGTVDGAAVALFVQRAADAGVVLEPTEAVAELCRRLDGIPLAIELAAARARTMTPEEMLVRLDDGLEVLDRPRRRSARRHQSLRAAIRWSHDLLDPEEQALFARLSTFPGPFTAVLAHTVASPPGTDLRRTEDLLDRLVAASMVVADHGPAGTTWFRVLEALRAFGREQLGDGAEQDAMAARFVDSLAGRVAEVVAQGAAGWSAQALGDLMALYDNVAAAVRWCLEHDDRPDRAHLLVAVLWGVVHQAHTEEVGELAEAVLARWPDRGEALRPDVVATAATCRYMLGDDAGAVALATDGLGLADRSPFAGATLRRAVAQATRAAGDAEGGLHWFDETARVARGLGLGALAVEADAARAQILADLGRTDEALATIRAARAEGEAAGSEVAVAWTQAIEGSILLRTDPAGAVPVLETALSDSRRIGYPAGESVALRALAFAALLVDDVRGAATRAVELLDRLLANGSTYELRAVLDVAAPVLARAGRPGPAADLAATALARPVVSITASVSHELFPLDPTGGRELPTREAILVTRAELGELARPSDPAGPGDPARPSDPPHPGELVTKVHQERGTTMTGSASVGRGAGGGRSRPTAPMDERVFVLRRAGELWEVGQAGDVVTVRASKGLVDLARLVAQPHREVHCLDLMGASVVEGDTGPVLDDTARRRYEERVRELQAEVDDADAAHDRARAERARAELDALVDQLTEALGLAGRSRRGAGSSAERARQAVTQRIRSTIKRLAEAHPRLGRHLQASVRTGTWCCYTPETDVRWQL